MSRRAVALLLLMATAAACPAPRPAMPERPTAEDPERLPIGRSPHRHELVRVRPGELVQADATPLAFPAAALRLGSAQVVFIGESHAHREHHAVQAEVLEALAARDPGRWALGMEMFPVAKQPVLDRWIAGELEERDFVRAVDWYTVWGFDWRYYRDLLLTARRHRLPVVALNAEPSLARKIGRNGLEALPAAERAALPELDLGWVDHRRLFRAMLGFPPGAAPAGGHGHGHGKSTDPHRGAFDNIYAAQVLWDATMARTAREFLEGKGRGRRLVVVAGSGHVLYGLGINGRLAVARPEWSQLTLLCESVPLDGELVSAGMADLLRGTAPEGKAMEYPSLGVALADDAPVVRRVSPHGPATDQIEPGDRVLAVDGEPVADLFDLRWKIQQKDWGDSVRLRVKRGATERELTISFNLRR